jgi:hypothetical protein
MRAAILALVAVGLALTPASAEPQVKRTPKEVVRNQLDAAPKMVSGLLASYGEFEGELAKDAKARHRIVTSADPDQAVQLVGACDEGCGVLDLKLLDEKGAVVGEVLLADSYPLVFAETEPKTAYDIEVAMVECSQPTCLYGVRAWRKARLKGPND